MAQRTGTALGKEATMHKRYDRSLENCASSPFVSMLTFGRLWAYAEGKARPERVPELHATQEAPGRVSFGPVDHGCHTCCTVRGP